MVTETDEVSEALAAAAARWPDASAAELLRRLVAEGHAALRASVDAERPLSSKPVASFTEIYEPGYLQALRDEWPA